MEGSESLPGGVLSHFHLPHGLEWGEDRYAFIEKSNRPLALVQSQRLNGFHAADRLPVFRAFRRGPEGSRFRVLLPGAIFGERRRERNGQSEPRRHPK